MGVGAPFLYLVEYGNGDRAYPRNSPSHVLESFRSKYKSMMRNCV
jgi:hypothetical protein